MRLIDADAIQVLMKDACVGIMSGCVSYNEPIKVLESAPTIDAVEVVRCKECVHKRVCPLYGGSQFFCAYGERGEADE